MQRTPNSEPALQALAWDDVKLFLALCRARTLGEAARSLQVDTSTVSRRLSGLEDVLGATLFDRDRGGVHPTAAVEPLLPVAEEIEHAMLRFAGTAEKLERTVTGTVRVACPSDAAEALIVPGLPALLQRHPGLQLELSAGEALVDVARRAVDIALRTVRPETGDLVAKAIGTVTLLPAAAPAMAAELGTIKRWQDVPWVGWGERFADSPGARWLRTHAPDAVPRLRSDSLRLQIAAIAQGLGAGLLPAGSVRHYGLEALRPTARLRRSTAPCPAGPLFLVTHRALRNVPRVAAVWDFLVEQAARRL